MNGRIVTLDTSTHHAAQELLPWLINGTLERKDAAWVWEHVQNCSQCQADFDWQRKLREATLAADSDSDMVPDVERALDKLRPRLATAKRTKRGSLSALLQRLWHDGAAWMWWTMAAQTAVIVGLAVLLIPPSGDIATFHGLGTPANAAGNVVVMLRPQTAEREWRHILQESGARIVDGPTATNAYVLHVPSTRQTQVIHALRSNAAVTLAEPLDSRGDP